MSDLVPAAPQTAVQGRPRPVLAGIPALREDRARLLACIRDYVRSRDLVPPLCFQELSEHCQAVLDTLGLAPKYQPYVAVLLNNEVWRDSLAGIPFDRRLLLLPKCLRNSAECAGTLDEFGLVCRECGRCNIRDFKKEAERLGYVTLVAEGAAVVISLIETGRIEAIIGVSCLASLERIFPCIEAAAVPGIAIPLLQDGCVDTQVDIDWVWEAIHLADDVPAHRLNMEALRAQVESWFAPAAIQAVLGGPANQTERIAQKWLALSGKRWRPFLAACVCQALQENPKADPPEDIRKVALAVECFHKASLVHDDIEDNDAYRYGLKTLHEEYGLAIALNVGDFLLGEGYRLIAETSVSAPQKAQMLAAAAAGHRCLCAGQGEELLWMRDPQPLSVGQVLDIFRHKTAPAFEVALRLGAICAGAGEQVRQALAAFSQALGVAYQIRDDLDDFSGHRGGNGGDDDVKAMRPSLLLAMAHEKATGAGRELLEAVWRRQDGHASRAGQLRQVFGELKVRQQARGVLDSYKEQAIQSLRALDNSNLKGLLRRVLGKIFNDGAVAAGAAPGDAARKADADRSGGNGDGDGAGPRP
ncbi:MAG: polyprenyl synthetase family protein [Phycisphaerae bacterium]